MAPFQAFIVLLQVTLAAALTKTTFTLYTSLTAGLNWQSAITFCRDQGQELVSVTSSEENGYLKSLGQPNKVWYNKNHGHLWSSLHDPNSATPGVGYQWQLRDPSSCLALSSVSWSLWYSNEPLNTQTSHCIKLEWATAEGYPWRSENCDTSYQKVICRASGGACSYKAHSAKTIVSVNGRTVTFQDLLDSAQCQRKCSDTSIFLLDCWAALWTPSTKTCQLVLSDKRFTSSEIQPSADSEQMLYTPQCLHSYLNESSVRPRVTNAVYNPNCSESTTAGEESSSQDDSVTDSRQKLQMTYIYSNVTWSVANSTCELLTNRSTLVTPNDAITTSKLIEFLTSHEGTNIWLGEGNGTAWQDDVSTRRQTNQCVTGTIVQNELQWNTTSCTEERAAIMCQTTVGDECTYEVHENTAMSSDWILENVTDMDECINYCNDHMYRGQECLGFAYITSEADCYFVYSEGPEYAMQDVSLYIRDCVEIVNYDNSSDAVNSILYPTSTTTTASASTEPPVGSATSTEAIETTEFTTTESAIGSTLSAIANTGTSFGRTTQEEGTITTQPATPIEADTATKSALVNVTDADSTLTSSENVTSQKATAVTEGVRPERPGQCVCHNICPTASSLTPTEHGEALSELVSLLTIDHKQTSRNKRKYISAEDNRPSAQAIGSMGIVILVSLLSVIVAMDVSRFLCSSTPARDSAIRTKIVSSGVETDRH